MSVRVFIDGAVGTTGLEIRERLAGRDDVTVTTLSDDLRKDAAARSDALNAADVVVLCLPDDAAREAVALVTNPAVRIIDASSAHRTAAGWTYGFPEIEADRAETLRTAARVTNPGCYPTGFLALVRPLVRSGLIPADWLMTVNATSGYSGGGKAMIAEFEGASPAPAFRAYALGLAHKHVPEMQAHAGLAHAPIFAPAVANTYRGMVVEVPLHLHAVPGRPTLAAIRDCWTDAYAGHPLVRLGAEAAAIAIADDAGTDRLTLHACGNDAAGQARLVATLDNLGKGAAGAAVQNLNIMAGLDPLAGLTA
ncbi:N-acetyl-gamma-glutamyl-phosphate reductase [Sphingomonas sp. EC-HK361]|uniref:N-acetyl-gamma-glutamyl-phosphate reductase n=1 Tax=Sphingomonas sp. EC-HK361 TaxID=2038397 RepID=UPI0012527808|nr:N-acetyl-gamma-glutamyl-phosphate reductase [Sphingomonas sp. EC-HK361]VVT11184.1 N-acetyl-gamma-glutamyl-phosphate reductase [Sphingomonas sp. EC-HK361]